jgi:ribosomal protein S18 acetylase RimI-like enzyme
MPNLSFRPAAESDLAGIVAMLADDELGCKREDPSVPLNQKYTDSFAAISRDPNQLLAVVEHKGHLLGCLHLTFIPGLSRLGMWRGQIESVRIATDCRGRGLGRKMFEWAIAECGKRGCGLVQLTTDKSREEAVQFYESLGFRASHEGMKLDL